MEGIIETIMDINEPKTLFYLCAIFIFSDVVTGYLKALRKKKINSSISRNGYIKKIAWIVALLLGYFVDYLVKVDIFLIGTVVVCIMTEGISVYENLDELGVRLPFKKYFERVDSD